jgi:hypothetical protein
MSFADAFAPIQAINEEVVKVGTWGHLSPEPHRKYYGWIIVAVGTYRESIVLDDEFPELPNSPWQYDDLHEFSFEATSGFKAGLYKFEGWYKKFKNGNYRFGGGKFKRVEIADKPL